MPLVLFSAWAGWISQPRSLNPYRKLITVFIGDVGQNAWEEVNLGAAGVNYGWRLFEGPLNFTTPFR